MGTSFIRLRVTLGENIYPITLFCLRRSDAWLDVIWVVDEWLLREDSLFI